MRFKWLLLAAPLALLSACDEDDVETCPPACPPAYEAATSPENQIENIQIAYQRRDGQGYAKILGPEFFFKFQSIDANEIGTPYWTHNQDSTGTCALFKSPQVSGIRISLGNLMVRDSIDTSPPVDTLKIRVGTVELQVDETAGTTWVVSDQQDMFFRKGIEANGENLDHWLLYEWDDLPTLTSVSLSPQAGRQTTWGKLKTRY